jgi:dTDP-4-dehydrorhamnose reductase
MSWLILGGSGQLGLTLQETLRHHNISYDSPTRDDLDLRSQLNLEEYITKMNPAIIVNCAAWTNVNAAESNELEALAINGIAVGHIAKYAKKASATFMQISTDYVFSGDRTRPWSEMDYPKPSTAYGRSKLHGEKIALDIYPENTYIFRTAWLYSKYGNNFAKTITSKAFTNENLSVVNDQIGQPTLANDLATQIILSVTNNIPPGIYHATNSGQASWFEFALEIFSILGQDVNRIKPITSCDIQQTADRPAYSVLSHGAWDNTRVTEMQDWKLALRLAMPEILQSSRSRSLLE